ncbi:hypothetical protein CFP56_028509 [Quercus suber]|uniref:Uncharacterized protein n=1 Tax=Quercus suber TaxID=58331 RepID=A0AAW0JUV7_QUESU
MYGTLLRQPPIEPPEDNEFAFNNAMALYLICESFGLIAFLSSGRLLKPKLLGMLWQKRTSQKETNLAVMQNNENNLLQYVDFAKNIRKGDWNAAKEFLSSTHCNPWRTYQHCGRVGEANVGRNLEIKDNDGLTVLGCSAIVGNIQITKCITQKNRRLLSIGNSTNQLIPVVLNAVYNAIDLARYLYSETPLEDLKPENGINGATFITRCIYAKAFVDKTLIKQIYELKLLHYQSADSAQLLSRVCHELPGLIDQQLSDARVLDAVLKAIQKGLIEFVIAVLSTKNELAWSKTKETSRNTFMWAVQHLDIKNNNILHVAAILDSSSGRTVQVQLYRCKENYNESTNEDGRTPRELITETHKELVDKGEK